MSGWLTRSVNLPQIPQIPWVPGRFYHYSLFIGAVSSLGSVNIFDTSPIYVPNIPGILVSTIGIHITIAASAGSVARMGIYSMNSDGIPDKLLLDAGTVAIDSIGYKFITINYFLSQGWYFMALATQGSPTFDAITELTPLFGLTGVITPMDTGTLISWNYRQYASDPTVLNSIIANGLPGHWVSEGAESLDYSGSQPRLMLGV